MKRFITMVLLALICHDALASGFVYRRREAGGSPPAPSWVPSNTWAYFDFTTSATPTNQGYSNITLTVVNSPVYSNSIPGRTGGAYWFKGEEADFASIQRIRISTQYPSPSEDPGTDWFVAVTYRPARLYGNGDEWACAIGRGNGSGAGGGNQIVLGHYGTGMIGNFYNGSANYYASQVGTIAVDTWYTDALWSRAGILYSRFHNGSTVTGGTYAAVLAACTNDWYLGCADASGRQLRGFVAGFAIGGSVTESEVTNITGHLSQ